MSATTNVSVTPVISLTSSTLQKNRINWERLVQVVRDQILPQLPADGETAVAVFVFKASWRVSHELVPNQSEPTNAVCHGAALANRNSDPAAVATALLADAGLKADGKPAHPEALASTDRAALETPEPVKLPENPAVPEESVVGTAMKHRQIVATVEYTDTDGTRKSQQFMGAPAARRFYLKMSVAGADPKVVDAVNASDIQAAPTVDTTTAAGQAEFIRTHELNGAPSSAAEAVATVEQAAPTTPEPVVTEPTAPAAPVVEPTVATPAPAKEKANGGLTGREISVLKALAGATTPLTREHLRGITGINKGFSKLLGAGTKEDGGRAGADSLGGRGLVSCSKIEGEKALTYTITTAGREALTAASK